MILNFNDNVTPSFLDNIMNYNLFYALEQVLLEVMYIIIYVHVKIRIYALAFVC